MKSTVVLTIALFLASAPSPDSKAVSEFSAGFLSPAGQHVLMADEFISDIRVILDSAAVKTARPTEG